jgi:hypothetical protein
MAGMSLPLVSLGCSMPPLAWASTWNDGEVLQVQWSTRFTQGSCYNLLDKTQIWSILFCACHVFDRMAAREKCLNFWNLFGGAQRHNICDLMMVVVVILVMVCKDSKKCSSSHYSHIAFCFIYPSQTKQSQPWWSTTKLLLLTCSWMRWKDLEGFGLRIFQTRGVKRATFYNGPNWPLSYVCTICIFLWFESGFFYTFMFVFVI